MKWFPWGILLALLAGFGLGTGYAWLIAPHGATNTGPNILRADFKDQYRVAAAAAFAATDNLPRAEARLALLHDSDPIAGLNSQAQRAIASGESTEAEQLAALAAALQAGYASSPVLTPTLESAGENTPINPTETMPPTPQELPFQTTETPPFIDTQTSETQLAVINPMPRPTRTLIPTLGAPFALTTQENVCDPNLPDGLLQVMVFNSSHRQVAGAKIIITWENGADEFFTGLKPEVGNGYADFIMSPNTTYTLQLASGSDIATGLIASTCQTPSGETFLGGIKLTFQQP